MPPSSSPPLRVAVAVVVAVAAERGFFGVVVGDFKPVESRGPRRRRGADRLLIAPAAGA